MRIAGIVRDSIVDGTGVRDVVFVQGCSHHCKGCHNPHTWDTKGGTDYEPLQIVRELGNSSNDITISGGEPLDQFIDLLTLLRYVRSLTNKKVWLYTGYTVDLEDERFKRLVRLVDVVVDGEYVESLNDPNLPFRGSSNQRVIDLKKSYRVNEITEINLDMECEQ